MFQYFPSCNFTKMNPQASKWIVQYMKKQDDVKVMGCCRRTQYTIEDQALIVCQSCRTNIQSKGYSTKSIWEYIDEHEDFPLPDYTGLEISLQHCWRDRDQPQVQQAVLNILHKMNITVHTVAPDYCGNFHMEPTDPALKQQLDVLENHSWDTIPDSLKEAVFKDQANKHGDRLIITYCNRCLMGFQFAKVNAKHLLQLIYEGINN